MFFSLFKVFCGSKRCLASSNIHVIIRGMKILNVAEKNDAAKNIANFLSNGSSRRREGISKFNKIYEFKSQVLGQNCDMMMTSVSGHLLTQNFIGCYKSWTKCSPEALFDAPLEKICPDNFLPIKKTLEREIRSCDVLIIWTDCDREGENIGFEIINICKAVKPRIRVYRAKFSEITAPSVKRALANLEEPNKNISDAVEVRSELDMRIGCSFTRFQTLRLTRVFPRLAEYLLSYGPCQFPTLGFVVERFLERQRFVSEPFWKIKVTHTIDRITVEFSWKRNRLFCQETCEAILSRCEENPTATVENVQGKPKSKWRPTPLDTIEMEKLGSRKLKINAKETMKIAEKLYTQGFISYPRTETNIFPDSLNLGSLVEMQTEDRRWGEFARKVLNDGANPRQGKKSDQSHPPIHPTKYTDTLQGNEAKLYEFIVRHFLACVSKDAQGHETTVNIDINGEKFTGTGLVVLEKNYLEVYIYEGWSGKEMHNYQQGQQFEVTTLGLVGGETSAPNLLTEADLIALMEKHGIGTDATHAEHIETIKQRFYVGLEETRFVPSAVGMGLVQGYDSMGFHMSKPKIRADLEADLKKICDGEKRPEVVLAEFIHKYRELFRKASDQVNKIEEALGSYLGENAVALEAESNPLNVQMDIGKRVMSCKSCNQSLHLQTGSNQKLYISCINYPRCKASIGLPNKVTSAKVLDESCPTCGPDVKQIEFKFRAGSMIPYYPDHYIGCVNGCDKDFIEMLGVRIFTPGGRESKKSTHTQRPKTTTTGSNTQRPQPPPPPLPPHHRNDRGNQDGRDDRRGTKRPHNGDDDDDDNAPAPTCICGLPAKKLTVRREGPNQGRDFFVCPKDDDKCSLYTWADEVSLEIKCHCQITAKKMTVRKEGFNQGRQFYGCPKQHGSSDRCQFFVWADEAESDNYRGNSGGGGRGGGGGSGHRGRGSFTGGSNSRSSSGGRSGRGGSGPSSAKKPKAPPKPPSNFKATGSKDPPKVRKCGICSQPGHNRKNCPQNGG